MITTPPTASSPKKGAYAQPRSQRRPVTSASVGTAKVPTMTGFEKRYVGDDQTAGFRVPP
jgi:hypothetical protein